MNQTLFFCTQEVNRTQVVREVRRGVEHIIINSLTLPPNIVMNGIMFATSEITEDVIEAFNRTPATIEHPEVDGSFVSANDPEIDLEGFRIGAFNENAHRTEDGRVSLDKVINVQKALQHEKGKRLLDRIEELETNENPRPIHTSIGVYTNIQTFDEVQTNELGQQYQKKAVGIVPDHDAILIDSIGAATPSQGTGIGVNKESIEVIHFIAAEETKPKPKTNAKNEGDPMREIMIAKLEKLGLTVNTESTDEELMVQLEEALSVNNDDNKDDKPKSVTLEDLAAFAQPILDRFTSLENQMTANAATDITDKTKVILANAAFSELDEDILKSIHSSDIEKFNSMYAKSIPAFNVGNTVLHDNADDDEFKDYDLNAGGTE